MPKVVAYIAGPYRGKTIYETVQNIRYAEQYALKYWQLGYTVICPHKNTALFDGAAEDETWLNGAMELLRRSDVIVMIPGWKRSLGSKAEMDEAYKQNKEVIFEK